MRVICPPDHDHGATWTCGNRHRCKCAGCRGRKNAWRRDYSRRMREARFDPMAVDLAVDGVEVEMTYRQRVEAVRVLWGRRWSDRAIAERLRMSDRSVLRIRHRVGLSAWPMDEQVRQARAA